MACHWRMLLMDADCATLWSRWNWCRRRAVVNYDQLQLPLSKPTSIYSKHTSLSQFYPTWSIRYYLAWFHLWLIFIDYIVTSQDYSHCLSLPCRWLWLLWLWCLLLASESALLDWPMSVNQRCLIVSESALLDWPMSVNQRCLIGQCLNAGTLMYCSQQHAWYVLQIWNAEHLLMFWFRTYIGIVLAEASYCHCSYLKVFSKFISLKDNAVNVDSHR